MTDAGKSIGFLMHDVSRLMRRNFLRRAQKLGLSQAQWMTLFRVYRHEGVKQITLAESMEIQPITLARLIDSLEESGLVDRRRDPDDRRAFRIYLTEKAHPFLDEVQPLLEETRETAMVGFTEQEKTDLLQKLSHIKQNLQDAECLALQEANDRNNNDND
ncbi:MarR family winged helix-turn-helix transcriptional regulator [Emcibacter nanhaiensis]|uniref:MarR family transcriptional regulator n=1 Tax=Emcibacter nanhaiensis TaxID=1505037 RepID=A0A501PRH7_9PROT|nr:MarR family transcriptional regulator [Emcibacter nanhaiensis]TPD62574.1 MarR family transcriptional regulator [Emcibacter nanhaiensis]